MNPELTAIPLGLLAGVAGVLSPCVWPLIPVVTASASVSGRAGPWWLAGGLSVSFALAGTGLTYLLVSTGLDPELFRFLSAVMLVVVAVPLLVPPVGERLTGWASALTARLDGLGRPGSQASAAGQFGVGALLGVVWLPCVGPTLGAAIALASLGQDFALAFLVMLAYGAGTAGVLLIVAGASRRILANWRESVPHTARTGKRVLGWSLLVLGALVLTGTDKVLERLTVDMIPAWVFGI